MHPDRQLRYHVSAFDKFQSFDIVHYCHYTFFNFNDGIKSEGNKTGDNKHITINCSVGRWSNCFISLWVLTIRFVTVNNLYLTASLCRLYTLKAWCFSGMCCWWWFPWLQAHCLLQKKTQGKDLLLGSQSIWLPNLNLVIWIRISKVILICEQFGWISN